MNNIEEMDIKLPKQWMHWAKKAGLRGEWGHGKQRNFYLIGANRHWRVNCHGDFECSCQLQYFDRWVNSRGAKSKGFPKSEMEFLMAVRFLIERSEDAR